MQSIPFLSGPILFSLFERSFPCITLTPSSPHALSLPFLLLRTLHFSPGRREKK